nr:hypothetical protein [Tanacetum cinerariifolium]
SLQFCWSQTSHTKSSDEILKPFYWKGFSKQASSAHQELHKIIRDEIFPIVNQVDARLQNFEIQISKEAAKFVGDFKSLANEVDASLAKHKALELEIEGLLKAVVSQDIMIMVQNESVVDTSDLQTKLERTKERFENCIIKKESEYANLWNDWYKKCDECKYDKILYDKAYKDMQQKIDRLQAQLGDLKGKSKDTSSVSDTRNPLSRKLENKNVELEFQVLNYAGENAHLKATYKNLYDSISVSQETLQLAQESRDKMKQINKEIKPANYTKINHLSRVFVPQKALSREELYFSNNSKTANVSKSFLIPNEDLSNDTTPSVVRKFLNEEAAKFVGDFKSLANEADTSLAKHKALELEIERLLKAVVSQDIMIIVQNKSVLDTLDL